jgi:hypothetical protein
MVVSITSVTVVARRWCTRWCRPTSCEVDWRMEMVRIPSCWFPTCISRTTRLNRNIIRRYTRGHPRQIVQILKEPLGTCQTRVQGRLRWRWDRRFHLIIIKWQEQNGKFRTLFCSGNWVLYHGSFSRLTVVRCMCMCSMSRRMSVISIVMSGGVVR